MLCTICPAVEDFEVMISDHGKRWRVRIYKMRAIQRRGAAQLVMSIWDA
jgi:hypothetical protein